MDNETLKFIFAGIGLALLVISYIMSLTRQRIKDELIKDRDKNIEKLLKNKDEIIRIQKEMIEDYEKGLEKYKQRPS